MRKKTIVKGHIRRTKGRTIKVRTHYRNDRLVLKGVQDNTRHNGVYVKDNRINYYENSKR